MNLLDSSITPRNMICIGTGDFSAYTCLSIAGLDHGSVYSLDGEFRYYWEDDVLNEYPNLDPGVKKFFTLRDNDELPERPFGYDHCYHITNSFYEFINHLDPSCYED